MSSLISKALHVAKSWLQQYGRNMLQEKIKQININIDKVELILRNTNYHHNLQNSMPTVKI